MTEIIDILNSHIKPVEILGETIDPKEWISIDTENLGEELSARQLAIYSWWDRLRIEADAAESNVKKRLDELEAKLDSEIRKGGTITLPYKKVTEKAIETFILDNDEYQELRKEHEKAKLESDYARHLVTLASMRKELLQSYNASERAKNYEK